MKIRSRALVIGVLSLFWTACAGHLVYASGAYRGHVVDAETKQRLAGAVVLAIWKKQVPVGAIC